MPPAPDALLFWLIAAAMTAVALAFVAAAPARRGAPAGARAPRAPLNAAIYRSELAELARERGRRAIDRRRSTRTRATRSSGACSPTPPTTTRSSRACAVAARTRDRHRHRAAGARLRPLRGLRRSRRAVDRRAGCRLCAPTQRPAIPLAPRRPRPAPRAQRARRSRLGAARAHGFRGGSLRRRRGVLRQGARRVAEDRRRSRRLVRIRRRARHGAGRHRSPAGRASSCMRALTLDPAHPKALEMAGSAAYEQRDFASAARYWRDAARAASRGLAASIASWPPRSRGPSA